MSPTTALPTSSTSPVAARASANSAVVSKAVVRAAQELGVRQSELALILGISPASTSRLVAGDYPLPEGSKPFEMALLVIRVFRSLSGVFGDHMSDARIWMRTENRALRGVPAQLMATATGLVNTVAYLDAARARI